MAGNTVEIQLRARDGASQTFKQVGREAQVMGRTIDTSASTSERSLSKLSKAGAATGAAFAALSGTLTLASRANAEAEASQARLETAIDNTGHSMFEYEDALKAASQAALQLGFDDEDAADSIAILTTATGDASKAIEDLSIAEDIARARNISLEAATKLVVAAEQGRVGALARVGIQLDETSTREERLDALRGKFAGNAEAYSKTSAAGYDRLKNSAENALEAIGAHLGPTQELLMILPGLSAGFTGVGAAVGAIAPNFTKATAAAKLFSIATGPVGIAAGLVAAAGAAVYFSGILDSTTPSIDNSKAALDDLSASLQRYQQLGSTLAVLNQETVTDIGDITNAYGNYLSTITDFEDAITRAEAAENSFAQSHPGDVEGLAKAEQATKDARAALEAYRTTADYVTLSDEKLSDATFAANAVINDTGPAGDVARDTLHRLNEAVESGSITWTDYADRVIDLNAHLPEMNQNMIESGGAVDDTTTAVEAGTDAYNKYFDAAARALTVSTDEMAALREQAAAQEELNQKKADYAAFAGMQVQTGDLTSLIAQNAALKEQQGAYYGVRDGINSVNEAQAVFKQTQDGILASQEPFNQQLSEYNGQLSNLEAAEDLLNERRAAGIPITAAQEDFLTRVDAAQARLQGGTEDATLALGEQALQYAENMRIGDELNRNMGDTADATSALDQTIQDLIIALQGIPGYVKATIDVESDDAQARADFVKRQLDALNGYYANATISVGLVGPGVGFTMGGQHGGVIPHAQHGAALNGWSWVGEAGPELIHAPGAMVLPHTASVATTQGKGGGGTTITGNTINVYANDPRSFVDQMRSYTYAGARA